MLDWSSGHRFHGLWSRLPYTPALPPCTPRLSVAVSSLRLSPEPSPVAAAAPSSKLERFSGLAACTRSTAPGLAEPQDGVKRFQGCNFILLQICVISHTVQRMVLYEKCTYTGLPVQHERGQSSKQARRLAPGWAWPLVVTCSSSSCEEGQVCVYCSWVLIYVKENVIVTLYSNNCAGYSS